MTYQEYLKTPHWRAVRAWAIERAGGRCQIDRSRRNLQVHHNNYEHLGAELPEDVIVLCDDCHDLFNSKLPPVPVELAPSSDFSSEETLTRLTNYVEAKRRFERQKRK